MVFCDHCQVAPRLMYLAVHLFEGCLGLSISPLVTVQLLLLTDCYPTSADSTYIILLDFAPYPLSPVYVIAYRNLAISSLLSS